MFYKSGKVISDQFEHLNMFSFWGNSENGCRGGGGPLFPQHNFGSRLKSFEGVFGLGKTVQCEQHFCQRFYNSQPINSS